MKSCKVGLIGIVSFVLLSQVVWAGVWATERGSGEVITGRFATRSPLTGAINGSLSLSNFRTNGSSAELSGAFADLPLGTTIFAGTIGFLSEPNSNIGRSIDVGTAQWGRFVGTVVEEQISGNTSLTGGLSSASRTLTLLGDFYVGNDIYYLGGPTAMLGSVMTVTFSRNSSSVGSIASTSSKWTLSTLGATPIPEPASMATFALGLGGYLVRRARRERSLAS